MDYLFIEVAIVRVGEFKQDRLTWTTIPVKDIQSKLELFFKVIKKVTLSGSELYIPPETPGSNDFLVKFEIVNKAESLFVPAIIHDIIRDLSANSRKYSAPGSVIKI